MSEDNETYPSTEDGAQAKLENLVPKDVTARKRVLAALLRALNSDSGRG